MCMCWGFVCVRMEVMVQDWGGGIRMKNIRIRKEKPSANTTLRGDVPG